MKQAADDFINNHEHINYCEAIIHRDGEIEYAIPSHTEKLIKITGENRDVIYEKMPVTASPILWLVDYTGCIALYTDFYYAPEKCTLKQRLSLKKLIDNGLVKNDKYN